jgi:hypothetical protein
LIHACHCALCPAHDHPTHPAGTRWDHLSPSSVLPYTICYRRPGWLSSLRPGRATGCLCTACVRSATERPRTLNRAPQPAEDS